MTRQSRMMPDGADPSLHLRFGCREEYKTDLVRQGCLVIIGRRPAASCEAGGKVGPRLQMTLFPYGFPGVLDPYLTWATVTFGV
jgi:hypothetical protein